MKTQLIILISSLLLMDSCKNDLSVENIFVSKKEVLALKTEKINDVIVKRCFLDDKGRVSMIIDSNIFLTRFNNHFGDYYRYCKSYFTYYGQSKFVTSHYIDLTFNKKIIDEKTVAIELSTDNFLYNDISDSRKYDGIDYDISGHNLIIEDYNYPDKHNSYFLAYSEFDLYKNPFKDLITADQVLMSPNKNKNNFKRLKKVTNSSYYTKNEVYEYYSDTILTTRIFGKYTSDGYPINFTETISTKLSSFLMKHELEYFYKK
ncbi:MAG: hypothetical protein NTX03_08440 [Bacteroidetes bacterium]|nr:hypothetical protein [Bacteroidota bacterium]